MTTEMMEVVEIIVFALVGGLSFMAGYFTRYLLSKDYDYGYCDGFADGKRTQK